MTATCRWQANANGTTAGSIGVGVTLQHVSGSLPSSSTQIIGIAGSCKMSKNGSGSYWQEYWFVIGKDYSKPIARLLNSYGSNQYINKSISLGSDNRQTLTWYQNDPQAYDNLEYLTQSGNGDGSIYVNLKINMDGTGTSYIYDVAVEVYYNQSNNGNDNDNDHEIVKLGPPKNVQLTPISINGNSSARLTWEPGSNGIDENNNEFRPGIYEIRRYFQDLYSDLFYTFNCQLPVALINGYSRCTFQVRSLKNSGTANEQYDSDWSDEVILLRQLEVGTNSPGIETDSGKIEYRYFTAPTTGEYIFESLESSSITYGCLKTQQDVKIKQNQGTNTIRNFKITQKLSQGEIVKLGVKFVSSYVNGKITVKITEKITTPIQKCGAPSNLKVNGSSSNLCVSPGTELTLTWDAGTPGRDSENNPVAIYQYYITWSIDSKLQYEAISVNQERKLTIQAPNIPSDHTKNEVIFTIVTMAENDSNNVYTSDSVTSPISYSYDLENSLNQKLPLTFAWSPINYGTRGFGGLQPEIQPSIKYGYEIEGFHLNFAWYLSLSDKFDSQAVSPTIQSSTALGFQESELLSNLGATGRKSQDQQGEPIYVYGILSYIFGDNESFGLTAQFASAIFYYIPTVYPPTNFKISDQQGKTTTLTWTNQQTSSKQDSLTFVLIDNEEVSPLPAISSGYKLDQTFWKNYGDGEHTITIIHDYYGTRSRGVSQTFNYIGDGNYIYYCNDGSWQKCEIYYYDDKQQQGKKWVRCIPYYYSSSEWHECK